jgi:hypothetical protein
MSINELGNELKEMYNNSENKERVVNIHLFGIIWGDIILKNNYTSKEIINASGLKKSYIAELNKGIKLSNRVIVK